MLSPTHPGRLRHTTWCALKETSRKATTVRARPRVNLSLARTYDQPFSQFLFPSHAASRVDDGRVSQRVDRSRSSSKHTDGGGSGEPPTPGSRRHVRHETRARARNNAGSRRRAAVPDGRPGPCSCRRHLAP